MAKSYSCFFFLIISWFIISLRVGKVISFSVPIVILAEWNLSSTDCHVMFGIPTLHQKAMFVGVLHLPLEILLLLGSCWILWWGGKFELRMDSILLKEGGWKGGACNCKLNIERWYQNFMTFYFKSLQFSLKIMNNSTKPNGKKEDKTATKSSQSWKLQYTNIVGFWECTIMLETWDFTEIIISELYYCYLFSECLLIWNHNNVQNSVGIVLDLPGR